jgi:hypothetical protein
VPGRKKWGSAAGIESLPGDIDIEGIFEVTA